jgi:negative regulator of flagellin synthesis FlgM
MMINGVNGINPLDNVLNLRKTETAASVKSSSDTVSLSPEAEKMAEMYYLDKIAQETPDVRADRIAEVKEKIKDPNYLSDSVIKSAADNFLSALGI